MYLIKKGVVIHKESGRRGTKMKGGLATLREGDYFGEVALVMRASRGASALATTYCLLYTLHSDDLAHALRLYPAVKRKIKDMAAARHRLQLYTSEGQRHWTQLKQRHESFVASPTPHRSRRPKSRSPPPRPRRRKADALARALAAQPPDMARHGSTTTP